jgi:hypothetical protein
MRRLFMVALCRQTKLVCFLLCGTSDIFSSGGLQRYVALSRMYQRHRHGGIVFHSVAQ